MHQQTKLIIHIITQKLLLCSLSRHIEEFDKVCHTGLLYKMRKTLPLSYFLILKSYIENRHFPVMSRAHFIESKPVCPRQLSWAHAIPNTADLLMNYDVTVTYADDRRRYLLPTMIQMMPHTNYRHTSRKSKPG
ncbi:hypothetical protein JTB14_024417 [Gonioctena quinquepunctata]|nr:hypothetical protein JTB14_024417 [Gonioctena quinquepunctata]